MGLGQTRDRTPGFAADGGAAVELRPGRSPGIVIRGLLRPLALPALRSLAPPPIYAPRGDADQLKEPRPTPLELGVPSGLRPPRASGWSWNPLCVVQSTRPVGAGFRQPWLWKPAPSLWPCPAGPIRGAPGLPRLHTPPTRRWDVWTALRPSGVSARCKRDGGPRGGWRRRSLDPDSQPGAQGHGHRSCPPSLVYPFLKSLP